VIESGSVGNRDKGLGYVTGFGRFNSLTNVTAALLTMSDFDYTIFGSDGYDDRDDDPDYIPDEGEDDADEEAQEHPTEEEDEGPFEGLLTGDMIAGAVFRMVA